MCYDDKIYQLSVNFRIFIFMKTILCNTVFYCNDFLVIRNVSMVTIIYSFLMQKNVPTIYAFDFVKLTIILVLNLKNENKLVQ